MLIKMETSAMGGGIDLLNPDKTYNFSGSGTTTHTVSDLTQKPRYIVTIVITDLQAATGWLSILDVNENKYGQCGNINTTQQGYTISEGTGSAAVFTNITNTGFTYHAYSGISGNRALSTILVYY